MTRSTGMVLTMVTMIDLTSASEKPVPNLAKMYAPNTFPITDGATSLRIIKKWEARRKKVRIIHPGDPNIA